MIGDGSHIDKAAFPMLLWKVTHESSTVIYWVVAPTDREAGLAVLDDLGISVPSKVRVQPMDGILLVHEDAGFACRGVAQ